MLLEPEFTEYLIIMHEMTHKNLSQTTKDFVLANALYFWCTFCSLFSFTNSDVTEALFFAAFSCAFFHDIRIRLLYLLPKSNEKIKEDSSA